MKRFVLLFGRAMAVACGPSPTEPSATAATTLSAPGRLGISLQLFALRIRAKAWVPLSG